MLYFHLYVLYIPYAIKNSVGKHMELYRGEAIFLHAIPLALVRWANTTMNSLSSPSCMSYLQTYYTCGKVRNACYIFKTMAKCPKEQKSLKIIKFFFCYSTWTIWHFVM